MFKRQHPLYTGNYKTQLVVYLQVAVVYHIPDFISQIESEFPLKVQSVERLPAERVYTYQDQSPTARERVGNCRERRVDGVDS